MKHALLIFSQDSESVKLVALKLYYINLIKFTRFLYEWGIGSDDKEIIFKVLEF